MIKKEIQDWKKSRESTSQPLYDWESLAKYSTLFDSDSVLSVFVKTVVGNGFVA